jgi:hypothetical protein
MNNYSKKSSKNSNILESNQTQAPQSFISSINFTSINSSEQKNNHNNSYTKNNCSCCHHQNRVSFQHSTTSSNLSVLSVTSAPLTACTYLTFDVKMASTPILNKRKSFNFERLVSMKTNNKKKQMSTPLAQSVKRQFSSTKQQDNADGVNACYASEEHYRHFRRHNQQERRPKYSMNKKHANTDRLRMYKNVEIIPGNVTSSELVDCNSYLKNFIKKSSSGRAKKIQMKKRMQKLNNVSTSTKKENTIVSVEVKKVTRKQHKNYFEYENTKKVDDLKRKTKTEFVKRIKLESAAAVAALTTHLPMQNVSENVLGFNNYFPNSCLNKFNQLGQLQVWFV